MVHKYAYAQEKVNTSRVQKCSKQLRHQILHKCAYAQERVKGSWTDYRPKQPQEDRGKVKEKKIQGDY